MRLQVLSDLHLEFHSDGGRQLIESYLKPDNVDVLIVAGDLATCGLPTTGALHSLCKRYKNAHVLFVPGNHDFYHSSFGLVDTTLKSMEKAHDNLSILDNKAKKIGKFLFAGSTLWFGASPEYAMYKPYMNDFKFIASFEDLVFKRNKKSIKFLKWHMCKDAIVITHHLPSWRSVPKRFKSSKLNIFYVCDLEKEIINKKPKMWIHGHTHSSCNYLIGNTHVVCNPFGYAGYELNPEFVPNFVIDTAV